MFRFACQRYPSKCLPYVYFSRKQNVCMNVKIAQYTKPMNHMGVPFMTHDTISVSHSVINTVREVELFWQYWEFNRVLSRIIKKMMNFFYRIFFFFTRHNTSQYKIKRNFCCQNLIVSTTYWETNQCNDFVANFFVTLAEYQYSVSKWKFVHKIVIQVAKSASKIITKCVVVAKKHIH